MRDKKGVEMSIQTMIYAGLGVLVLAIIVVLVIRQTGIAGQSVNACQERGDDYRCMSSCTGDFEYYSAGGCEGNDVCCIDRSQFYG